MIIGVGCDLVMLDRMRAIFDRWGDRLVDRILGPAERDVFRSRFGTLTNDDHSALAHSSGRRARAVSYLAKRFAGKEAVGKALGCGLARPMGLHCLELLNDAKGAPLVQTHGSLATHIAERGWRIHVSLSDERDIVQAFAVVETQ
jgi:holo-[acyl-carrier protein] synthase